jgi:TRAP-type mannitol/chloroaromatic compound transport system permease small subunit
MLFIDCYTGDVVSSLSCICTLDTNAAGSRLTHVSNLKGYEFFFLKFFFALVYGKKSFYHSVFHAFEIIKVTAGTP